MNEQQKVFPKPVDWDELYPGRFLKASDLKDKKPTLEIAKVDLEELEGEKGKEIKGVISFRGKDKQWTLNKTNGICLKALFGSKPQEWVGKRVTLFTTMRRNSLTGEDELCIRVWGGPDVPADFEVEIRLPRKKPLKMTMHRVDLNRPAPPAA